MEPLVFSLEMALVFALLGLAIVLFAFDLLRVDLAAITVLFLLAATLLLPGIEPLIDESELFSGFASNAVIAIIAVMIIGAGLDRSGVLNHLADAILKAAGRTERRVMASVSGAVGGITAFMQNIGAAALFLPVLTRVADATGIPLRRLLIPMGFAAITGGTLTLVASSPLILLNELMPGGLEPFGLFDVTPIGIALLVMVIAYFALFGRWVLPGAAPQEGGDRSRARTMNRYFRDTYGLDYEIHEARVEDDCTAIDLSIAAFEQRYRVFVVGLHDGSTHLDPARSRPIPKGARLAFMGSPERIDAACAETGLTLADGLDVFAREFAPRHSGVAELLVGPDSPFAGRTIGDLHLRRDHGIGVLRIQRGREAIRDEFADVELAPGDLLVVHTRWERLATIENGRDFIVLTSRYPKPRKPAQPRQQIVALVALAFGLGLVLFSPLPLAASLLGGALVMILGGVLSMDEAYRGISWKTVFLLASLIPLGLAVEQTSAGAWLAQQTMLLLADAPEWVVQAALFLLTSIFSLVMTNVGATVLMVPLAVNIAELAGADPRVFALIVGIAASNAFVLPTHQVNALILDPGGYRVIDFIRAGGPLTLLYATVALIVINLLF